MQKSIILVACLVLFTLTSCSKKTDTVSTVEEFNSAVKNAKPGDVITLANRVWNNTELVFDAKGTEENQLH